MVEVFGRAVEVTNEDEGHLAVHGEPEHLTAHLLPLSISAIAADEEDIGAPEMKGPRGDPWGSREVQAPRFCVPEVPSGTEVLPPSNPHTAISTQPGFLGWHSWRRSDVPFPEEGPGLRMELRASKMGFGNPEATGLGTQEEVFDLR